MSASSSENKEDRGNRAATSQFSPLPPVHLELLESARTRKFRHVISAIQLGQVVSHRFFALSLPSGVMAPTSRLPVHLTQCEV